MPETLKLALVTDIHNGKDTPTKKGGRALPLLRDFADFVSRELPDLVVELGDRISDIDPATDYRCLEEVAAVFQGLGVPCRHLLGNHDQVYLSREDNERALGQKLTSGSHDLKGWHLVFWQADVRMSRQRPPRLNDEDLAWLKADLASTNLPAIVFTHIPLDGASMTGNYYFEANPQFATYENLRAAQDIITGAGNVALCVAGHVHWNNVSRIDGIPFVTLQSLTESFTSQGQANGGWAVIEADRVLRWTGHGQDPIQLTVNLGGGNRRWTPPLPPFHQMVRPQPALIEDLRDVQALLLDLDGVVYRGDEPIPGAIEFLNEFVASGRRVLALTNNARASAADYVAKLDRMGFAITTEQILTSGQALAHHLAAERPGARFFLAGPETLRRELLSVGLEEADKPDFVVAGIDESMPLSILNEAVRQLHNGARLVASNGDNTLPTPAGLEAEAGAVVAFLEAASGQHAFIAGKPNPLIYNLALARLGLARHQVAMVGDTFDTDIAGANAAGVQAIYVESGNPAAGDGEAVEDLRLPDLAALRPYFGI